MTTESTETITAATQRWVEKAVIGLKLCPFAAAPHGRGLIHYCVSDAAREEDLLAALARELRELHASPPSKRETTLLIHPWVLGDFLQFNAFLSVCERLVRELGLEGEIQVASFHPNYQFADAAPDDMGNFTNRSPYPTLHLLREASVSRAVDSHDTAEIARRNVRTLNELGLAGWRALWRE